MDDRRELEREAAKLGSPGDVERASFQGRALDEVGRTPDGAVERVDQLGRPLPPDVDLPTDRAETAPHPDQEGVAPSERSIGQNVRAQGQNAQGTQGR